MAAVLPPGWPFTRLVALQPLNAHRVLNASSSESPVAPQGRKVLLTIEYDRSFNFV